MQLLPVFLDMQGRSCLVVGGGGTAARKVGNLVRAGAAVRVVSPEICDALDRRAKSGDLEHLARPFEPGDVAGNALIIAATDDRAVNREVARLANEHQIPVNVVDDPDACTFILPSIVDRAPVTVAVSTGRASPVLARLLRTKLESLIPAGYGRLAELSGKYRDRVKARFTDQRDRRRFWDRVLEGAVAERIFAGQFEEAEAIIEQELAPDALEHDMGEVYLVGAGPGDPDLLTFRALRLIQQADVVVYDRLVADAILQMARRDAKRIYVGKQRNHHAMRQEEINRLLADLAKDGHRVLRLKGGDPFIFGRGGEEIDTLAAEGVPFQVIPGITAASGCAAYAGIPLTHRDYAQSVVFVTGHLKDGSINLNWPALAQPNQTVVFYMGLVGLPIIVEQLMAHGVSADMPIALVQQGTTHLQRVYTGTLSTINELVSADPPQPPTLVIVGAVVELRDKLNWFRPPDEPVLGATTPIVPTA
ncbi:uroporphyrinogen-III C-methyltransferase [Thiorhodococcus mannitoliphagus]|uniref:Siroheme synthase n=1 Tax=Thiorhodococcus mannitoliphagus TaxID=329406 RepID=A0A6P1DTA7_9GAMM|nr:siroheme synthase CysG [Thiorhodococcus mannitoliphagus]NEX21049.1 uroporphyrinogen-III C-methyltransferase [Thiorhodococcus mannitoliphagus]